VGEGAAWERWWRGLMGVRTRLRAGAAMSGESRCGCSRKTRKGLTLAGAVTDGACTATVVAAVGEER